VITLAGPGFRDLVLNNRRATQINDMIASLNLARAEAVKRGARTVLCISDGNATPDCDSNPKGWEDGWIVFVDGNSTGGSLNKLDNPPDANGNGIWDWGEDALVEVHGPLAEATTLRGNTNVADHVTFNRLSGTNGTLRHCDSRGVEYARGIIISPTGRPRLSSDSDGDGTEDTGGSPPTELTCP
jgi:type IV fimbrial biogenesis protein FimT